MMQKSAAATVSSGRPRGFDADISLNVAVDLFWQQGFEVTSLEALSQAMGLSGSSFYARFGSKHAFLMAAVQRYADDRFASLTECVATCTDPHDAVRAMLAVIADVDGGTRGCLFVNAVTELSPGDARLVALAQAHTARVSALLVATLRRCGCAEDEASERSGALLALIMGITTLRKTGAPPLQLTALLKQAIHLIPDKPNPNL